MKVIMKDYGIVTPERLKKCIAILKKIDGLLDELEKVDPYGDMVENFCEDKTNRHTVRLIALCNEDLTGEKKYGN